MASIKVARDYLRSSQSNMLIGDEDQGPRKVIQIGTRRLGAAKTPEPSLTLPPPPPPCRQPRVIPRLATVVAVPVNADGANRDDHCSPDDDKTETVASECNVVGGAKSETKQWTINSEELQKGHAYRVKFLGECLVEQSKGTEVVKDAVRKMQFSKHIKRAEGQKLPKLDLIISADGITIQDPRSKVTMYQHPLHRISYCADDKADRELFTFIARESDSNKHYCYVFKSGKVAEEMALRVGQAFDTAYRRFLDAGSGASDTDYKEKWIELQKTVHQLQLENKALKRRVEDLGKIKDRSQLEQYMKTNQLSSLSSVSSIIFNNATSEDAEVRVEDDDDDSDEDGVINIKENQSSAQDQPLAGRPLEDLIFDLPTPQTSCGYSVSSQPPNSAACLPHLSTQRTQQANIEDVWGTGQSVMEQHSTTTMPAQTAPNVISAGDILGTGLSITEQHSATPLPTQTIHNTTSELLWGTGQLLAGQLSTTHQPTQTTSNVMKPANIWGTGQSVTAKTSGYNTGPLNPFAAPATSNIPAVNDPFGLGIFSPTSVEHGLPLPQEKLLSTQAGFGQGLFQVTENCSFDDLDPFNRLV